MDFTLHALVFHVLILGWAQHQWLTEKRGFLANPTSEIGIRGAYYLGCGLHSGNCSSLFLSFSIIASFRRSMTMAHGGQSNALSAECKILCPKKH